MASKQIFKQKVAELLEPMIAKRLEKRLRYDVSKEVLMAQNSIKEKILMRTLPNIGKLRGDVKKVNLTDVVVADKQLWLITEVEAVLKLDLDIKLD